MHEQKQTSKNSECFISVLLVLNNYFLNFASGGVCFLTHLIFARNNQVAIQKASK